MKKIPTKIYDSNKPLIDKVTKFDPIKKHIAERKIDPNETYGKWIYYREEGTWIMD